jgi:chorismate mutase
MIEELREQTNDIDLKIISLLGERNKLSIMIGEQKKINNIPIKDKEREMEMVECLEREGLKRGLNPLFVERLYKNILEESRRAQMG